MWGTIFSRDPIKDFAYECTEQVTNVRQDVSIWKIHRGKKKGTAENATVFVFDDAEDPDSLRLAKESVRRLKTLRHPGIVTYLDSVEGEKSVHVATEPVEPLESYLTTLPDDTEQRNHVISWGLYQILNVIKFLNEDGNMSHNNIGRHTVYVTQGGDWKLGGVEYLTEATSASGLFPRRPHSILKYDPPELANGQMKRPQPWSVDIWGYACMIWEVFNGELPSSTALKQPKKIPQQLLPLYQSLIKAPHMRPSPSSLIDQRKQKSGHFMNNPFVDSLLFLEEIQIKDDRDKSHFFSTKLPSVIDTFPDNIARSKVLPQLLNAYEYGNAGSAVLSPMFRLSRLLDDVEYQRRIVPAVVKLFSSPDRSTRVKLLEQCEAYVPHLQQSTVDKVFPNVAMGFMDSNPAVRDTTLKAMVQFAPKLSYNNLNVELMKQLARLQRSDDQPGIRTNMIICLGKIAPHLHPQNRAKVLMSAFGRALQDPFAPCRSSAILAFSATQQFYTVNDLASKVMSALAPILVDPDKQVRDQAFKAVNGIVLKLQTASDNPDIIAEMESQVNVGGASAASYLTATASAVVPDWAKWAIGSLGSRFVKTPASTPSDPGTTASGDAPTTTQQTTVSDCVKEKPSSSAAPTKGDFDDDVLEPWDDEPAAAQGWDVDEPVAAAQGWDEAEDDEWGSLGDEPTTPPNSTSDFNSMVSGPISSGKSQFSASVSGPIKSSLSTKQPPKESSDWDSFGGDDGGGWNVNDDDAFNTILSGGGGGGGASQRKSASQLRSEQRRKEMEERRQAKAKGAMKLGGKKLAAD